MASVTRHKGLNGKGKSGQALIEMLVIIPLFIVFILFTIFACRWLAYQGRILSAGRTAAWLVAHADKEDKVEQKITTSEFAQQLRRWHFDQDGVNAGVVVVNAPITTDGLFAGGGTMEPLVKSLQELGDYSKSVKKFATDFDIQASNVDGAVDFVDKVEGFLKEGISKIMDVFIELTSKFIESIVNALTKDFHRCEVTIDYWMKIPFNLAAYERLLGKELNRGSGEWSSASQKSFAHEGKVSGDFALLSLGEHTTCVLPVLDPGKEGGISEVMDDFISAIQKVLDAIKKLLKEQDESNLYRPMEHSIAESGGGVVEGANEVMTDADQGNADKVKQREFYALLVYEWYDPRHKKARK